MLLLATESWVDAGLGAQAAIAHTLEKISTEVLVTFNADELIDFRSRRPIVRICDGVVDNLSWPQIQLRAGQDAAGRDVLVLVGPEPDMAWHAFVRAVVDLATQRGVRLVVGLGAFAAPVPHTRPVNLMAIATTAELAAQVGVVPGTAEMPAGIQTALKKALPPQACRPSEYGRECPTTWRHSLPGGLRRARRCAGDGGRAGTRRCGVACRG